VRICAIVNSLTSGGAEMLVANLSTQFSSAGHKSTVVTLCDASQLGNSAAMEAKLTQQIEGLGGCVISLGLGKRRNPFKGLLAVRKAMRRIQPDIIHAHTARALPMLMGRQGQAPIILTHHNSRLSFPPAMFKLFDRQVSAYVAISHEARQIQEVLARKPIEYIPNAAGAHFVAGQPRSEFGNPARIISVGAISEQKNYDLLIDVARAVRERQTSVASPVFTIAGGGPDLERLRARTQELGLTENVQFLGECSDVHQLLRSSDIFLNTSRYEGMPISVLEAMAMALPIVATEVAGNTELVRHGDNGLLAPLDQPAELAAAIMDVLGSPERFSEFSARSLAEGQRYLIGNTAKMHLNLYCKFLRPA
jgi:glycosyltransferase involved in cell wall biosynthesis